MWVQDVAGVRPAAGSFFAGSADSLCTGPEMFPEDLHRLGALGFLMFFEAFLRQDLVHPQYYTSLYTSGNLLQVLVHHLGHPGPNQLRSYWCFFGIIYYTFLFILGT